MPLGRNRMKTWLCLTAAVLCVSDMVSARDGGRDPSDKALENAARAEERASRDAAKLSEDRIKLESRSAEERVKIETRAAEDFAKLEADRVEQDNKLAEEAAKIAEDLAEDQAKAAEDAAKDEADAAEDAAKEASSNSGHGSDNQGSSGSMRSLASEENPEFDSRGFPARRGEIVGLDLNPTALDRLAAKGFRVVQDVRLPALNAQLTRLRVPEGVQAQDALNIARSLDTQGNYDLSHYYGLNIGTAGAAGSAAPLRPKSIKGSLRIGMIDTGVTKHPMLKGTAIEARSFLGNGPSPTAHGTAIASLLASNGSSKIVAASVFRGDTTQPFTSADALIQALEWLVERDVAVINISLAGPRNAILDALIRRSIKSGHAIVAAAGNGGPTAPPAYPAAVPGVVAVTAVDQQSHVYRYANQGQYISFAAFGVGIPAAAPDGRVAGFTGTSFATPFVATVLARCANTLKKDALSACIKGMERTARDLGTPGRDNIYGHGLIGG